MPDTRKAPPAAVEPFLHRAARIENSVHRFREKRARRRGLLPTVVPYTGYGAPGWARVLSRVLLTRTGTLSGVDRLNVRGWRSFTSVPVEKALVEISLGGHVQRVQTDRGGVLDARIPVDLEPGWHVATLTTEGSTPVEAPIFVIDPEARFGIVSDIDDTVMVTSLPRPMLAAWNTFVLNEHARRPVPGMAVLYERLNAANPGCPVVYLSTGAWNVAPTLSRFLSRNLYPSGPLLLTDWGPTHDRIFRSGRLHKQESLRRLAEEFPELKWLLVGDDGQHDEELYGTFLHDHPQNVAAVAIRQLSPSEAVLAGGRSSRSEHAGGSDVAWVSAPDGAGLWEQLLDNGVID
ncbi:phosphatidate phosphatase APP1 [Frigoribacterium sp. PvP054]|uniref:App1 family protein n=1 Tax=Frigoribacterium sp. PvP054 TaxID=3156438 RepID=UPI003398B202